MTLLILNAAEGPLHFLLARFSPPEILCSQRWRPLAQGVEILAPALDRAFLSLGVSPASLSHIACVRGPGSFTGLRLALVTASGLARCSSALLAGLDYLPLLAAQAMAFRAAEREGLADRDRVWALTRARRNMVYIQGFAAGGEEGGREGNGPAPLPRTDIMALSLEDAARAVALGHSGQEGRAVLLGSGLTENRPAWEDLRRVLPAGSVFLPPLLDAPQDELLLRAAARVAYARGDIAPLYVRPSEAEDNLERTCPSLGLDPAAARRRLEELTGKASSDSNFRLKML
ncbi:MAG: tRNA (adenosine(37)-N6)-threonylcarbamoyltransferase complex dimerization subunit type 1 TsaB [Desulfovibrio sp.]|jgi:tRNA threonylcarbamoyl adenosine modification protein YeaZ|nr:tRNA (adenosine(37)-N6)-threonylcarbamoyltransferase complex dimerization subunit type 1 TsaB [Desulfovibrio sp.]